MTLTFGVINMIALLLGLLILTILAVSEIFHQRELKAVKLAHAEEFTDLQNEKMTIREQYHTVEVGIEDEIEALEEAVAAFEADKDPDSDFPAMESSIAECNAKANVQVVTRLYHKLFPEAYDDWIRRRV